jgi:hypothetical protein
MAEDQVVVPGAEASVWEIFEFALTYNGYERAGGFEPAAAVGNGVLEHWHQTGELPDDLDVLRTALFFEQRRWRHFDQAPDPETERYVRVVVAAIAALSGGILPGLRDQI